MDLTPKEIPEAANESTEDSPPITPEITESMLMRTQTETEDKPRISDREVMEHTASMWRYRPITDDSTEQHTESHCKRTVTANAEIIGARVRGKKHKHEGTNCDDYFETAASDDFALCVVCDGAGSKPLSRIGSRVCCETAAGFLKEQLPPLFDGEELRRSICADISSDEFMLGAGRLAALVQQSACEAFGAVKKELEVIRDNESYRKALGRAPVLSDMSSTFLAAVVVPLEIDGLAQMLVASVQIGDGCICAINSGADADECLKLMGEADSGEFSGETDFISEKNILPQEIRRRTKISRGCSDTVLLMTDGVADDYFPAQPMMKRLYLDLCLNGIFPMTGELSDSNGKPPVCYSSVSPERESVALQYAKQLISDKSAHAADDLWNRRDTLRPHSLEAFGISLGDSPNERLRTWLDNYNERGSFDDRTLAAIRLQKRT